MVLEDPDVEMIVAEIEVSVSRLKALLNCLLQFPADLWDYGACWTVDTKVGVVAQVLNGEKKALFYSSFVAHFEMALLTFQLVKQIES